MYLTLTFAHTTKIEHATEHKPNSRGATRLTARERPWPTNRCAGAAHTKYSRYVCPKSWRKLAFSRKEMCAVRPAGPKVSLLAAGGWRVARAAPHAQQDFGRRFAAAWGAGAAGVWSRVMSQAGPGRPVAPAQRRRQISTTMCKPCNVWACVPTRVHRRRGRWRRRAALLAGARAACRSRRRRAARCSTPVVRVGCAPG